MSDKYDKQSTARLPLIESVIIIAIFAVVSVVIMQMYISADRLQKKAVNISKAVILAENTAEEIRSGKTGVITVNYDSEWNVTDTKASFILKTAVDEDIDGPGGSMTVYSIVIVDSNGEELVHLKTGVADYVAATEVDRS